LRHAVGLDGGRVRVPDVEALRDQVEGERVTMRRTVSEGLQRQERIRPSQQRADSDLAAVVVDVGAVVLAAFDLHDSVLPENLRRSVSRLMEVARLISSQEEPVERAARMDASRC